MARLVPGQGRFRRHAKGPAGFSLIELVVVIVIAGVMASAVGLFIAGPIQGFLDQARRAQLVDAAQLAFVRMGRDLRAALPNSVRVSGTAIELLLTLDGDRYRTETAPGVVDDDQLQFNVADTSFNTFRQLGAGQVLPAGLRLAVYPLGQPTANPYVDTVLTPAGTAINVAAGTSTIGGTTEFRVTMNPGHIFPYESPQRRVFLVEGPVTYYCDLDPTSPTFRSLLRYSGYAVPALQAAPPAGGTAVTVVGGRLIGACAFSYDAGTAQRNAVVSMSLSLADPNTPAERVRLIRQVHVDNSP
jgi:MSHA biogenesis protein MshO